MAILRPDEIRNMAESEIEEQINDMKLELAKERGQIAVGGFPENPGRIKELRRTLARIKTIRNEKEEQ